LDQIEFEADLTPRSISRKTSTSNVMNFRVAKKSHRVVSSDSNLFSNSTNNLLVIEADTKDTCDLAHAERLVQALHGSKKAALASVQQRSPRPPRIAALRNRSSASAMVVPDFELPIRSTVDKGIHMGCVFAAPRIRQSRSTAEEEYTTTSITPWKQKKQHRHRRSGSHGSNQFEELNGQSQAHDVMTHGIAAYTEFV
jgi:hypothetical protein